jgi:hypothetical protein
MADNVTLNAGTGGDVVAADDIAGVKYQRVKVNFGADGSAFEVAGDVPLPVFNRLDGKTIVHFWALGVAAGATTVETAINLTRSGAAGSATTSGTSHVLTNGKRLRITSLMFASRGNATATAQVTTFTIRVNSTGAVTTTSPAWLAARTASPATALAWDRTAVALGDDGPEILGNGTIQLGVTANAVFTTNAPTWDVLLTAYEF